MLILKLTKALSDPTRLRLAALLLAFELNVGELVSVLGLAQSRVSNHLRILAGCGLAVSRRDGLWVYYRAADEGPARTFLAALRPLLLAEDDIRRDAAAAARVVAERTRESRKFFDALADEWSALSREILGDFDLTAYVSALLPEVGTAVDLGCGPGELVPALSARARRVIGVDQAPNMLAAARQRFGEDERIEFRLGELEHPPLREGEADAALFCLCLHHLAAPARGIEEATRCLAPGGYLLVVEFEGHQREEMRTRHGDRWLGFDPADVGAWLSQAGFCPPEVSREPLPSGLTLVFYRSRKAAAPTACANLH
jgi:ArsR family transcriptional regulator